MDRRRRQEAGQLHRHPGPMLLARRPQARRPPPLREELPPPVDELPPPGPQARPPQRRRGTARHSAPLPPRQQPVILCFFREMVENCGGIARKDRQRDQEPLEHPHQEEADQDGDRSRHPPSAR
ncbi:unnamed protein product [Linum tenue]|uniref:Uncharacterized protein n=1 Tax=Linum tenue TaxID=586396 RepID=A0AAV0J782_9ROSI|nr:unnamed protein product [Linum tenue]